MDQLYHSNPRLKVRARLQEFRPRCRRKHQPYSQPDHCHAGGARTMCRRRWKQRRFLPDCHRCIFCSLIDEALTFEATLYDRSSGEIRRKINVGPVRDRAEQPGSSRSSLLPAGMSGKCTSFPCNTRPTFLTQMPRTSADLAGFSRGPWQGSMRCWEGRSIIFSFTPCLTAKNMLQAAPSFHWHIEICPRTTIPNGFELGSGLFVNTICPEDAAERSGTWCCHNAE